MVRMIGLTGGIASGKSTVAALLRELGAEVIDADQLAREIVEPGCAALAEIVEAFGPAMLGPDGRLDRQRLGALVFADADKRARLNQITHPRIRAESMRRAGEAAERGCQVVVYEAALLVENGLHRQLDGLIVVAAALETQLARMRNRDGLAEPEARKRLAAQLPLEEKVRSADYVIDTNGPIEALRPQVERAWRDILAGGPRR